MRWIVAVFSLLVGLFCLYWFSPHIRADRAWAAQIAEFGKAADAARDAAAKNGLHSARANAAMVKATRLQFVTNCTDKAFKPGLMGIDQWNAILADCREQLLRQDAEWQEKYGKDYGEDVAVTPG